MQVGGCSSYALFALQSANCSSVNLPGRDVLGFERKKLHREECLHPLRQDPQSILADFGSQQHAWKANCS